MPYTLPDCLAIDPGPEDERQVNPMMPQQQMEWLDRFLSPKAGTPWWFWVEIGRALVMGYGFRYLASESSASGLAKAFLTAAEYLFFGLAAYLIAGAFVCGLMWLAGKLDELEANQ